MSQAHEAAHDAMEEAARLKIENDELRAALRDFKAWLIHKRQESVVHVSVHDSRGNYANGFSAVQIPEWDVRQKLDNVDAALGEPQSAEATK